MKVDQTVKSSVVKLFLISPTRQNGHSYALNFSF